MKIKDRYVVKVFMPEEFTSTMESGIIELKLCEKAEDSYIDISNGKCYKENTPIGQTKVISILPLSEYYYALGLKRKNEHDNKQYVHRLVKTARRRKKI